MAQGIDGIRHAVGLGDSVSRSTQQCDEWEGMDLIYVDELGRMRLGHGGWEWVRKLKYCILFVEFGVVYHRVYFLFMCGNKLKSLVQSYLVI